MMKKQLNRISVCLLFAAGYSLQVFAAEAIPVVSKPLSVVAIYPVLKAPANVISTSNSRISAEISGRITSLAARVGEGVEKGQALVRLEQEDYQLAVEREQAKLDAILARIKLADYELKRAISLSKKQAVSEQLLKQREAELDTLLADEKGQRVALVQSKRNLEKTVIRAPFQAVITEHLGQVGELAAPGTPLIQIVDSTNLEVSARIQTHYVEDIEKARSLTFISKGIRYPLQLRVITPVIDNKTNTREARLSFNDQHALPGSAGELVWEQPSASLPSELVVKRNGKLGVFIVNNDNNGQAQFVPLPGAEEGRPVATDLPLDTSIITQGRFRLQDGDSISTQTR